MQLTYIKFSHQQNLILKIENFEREEVQRDQRAIEPWQLAAILEITPHTLGLFPNLRSSDVMKALYPPKTLPTVTVTTI